MKTVLHRCSLTCFCRATLDALSLLNMCALILMVQSHDERSRCTETSWCVQIVDGPIEAALACFAGRPGAPQPPAWQLRPPAPPHSDASPRVPFTPAPFPQAQSLSASLTFVQLRLFGVLFPLLTAAKQEMFIEALTVVLAAEATSGSKANRKAVASVPARVPCVATCALLGLAAVARQQKAAPARCQPLADAAKDLALALLQTGPGAVRAGACQGAYGCNCAQAQCSSPLT